MHQHPFVLLTGCSDEGPVATHVPVLLKQREGKLYLQGHIMRQTDHHKAFAANPNVLVVFTGPHTYVSASWYTEPRQASTWNYLTVHARGTLQFGDEGFLRNVLKETTAQFENNAHSPSLFGHLPEDYVERLIKAIVAFEIEVTSVEHVFKLSQNQDKESYENIIAQLSRGDADAKQMAEIMKSKL